jgi:hypothetical protein
VELTRARGHAVVNVYFLFFRLDEALMNPNSCAGWFWFVIMYVAWFRIELWLNLTL